MSFSKSTGNMYPWVTHCHSFLRGECPHKCKYCYARDPIRGHPSRQEGTLRMCWNELLDVSYPPGSTVFVEHKNDLWAKDCPHGWLDSVLHHNWKSDAKGVVYQSKAPARFLEWITRFNSSDIFGTTIETNRAIAPEISLAPPVQERAKAIRELRSIKRRTFITIEPVMDFDLDKFVALLVYARPTFVNIGADSKRSGLPEPDGHKIGHLVYELGQAGIEVRRKDNLTRLVEGGAA